MYLFDLLYQFLLQFGSFSFTILTNGSLLGGIGAVIALATIIGIKNLFL